MGTYVWEMFGMVSIRLMRAVAALGVMLVLSMGRVLEMRG